MACMSKAADGGADPNPGITLDSAENRITTHAKKKKHVHKFNNEQMNRYIQKVERNVEKVKVKELKKTEISKSVAQLRRSCAFKKQEDANALEKYDKQKE